MSIAQGGASNPIFVAQSITCNEHSFITLYCRQQAPIPSRNIYFARRRNFLCRAMSDVTSFVGQNLRVLFTAQCFLRPYSPLRDGYRFVSQAIMLSSEKCTWIFHLGTKCKMEQAKYVDCEKLFMDSNSH